MVKSDILLDDKGIEMLPADSAVEVNAGPAETPGIRLVPATASLRLGGGTSDAYNDGKTFGNIQLDSKDGDPRIVLDARDTRLILGSATGTGELLMYKKGLVETLKITGHDANLRVGGTNVDEVSGTLELESAGAMVTATLDAGPQGADGGSLLLADHTGTRTIDVSGGEGRIKLGTGKDGGGVSGSLDLVNLNDETTVSIESSLTASPGSGISLSNASGTPTATVDGGTGSLTLGAATENGTLSLHDGNGTQVDLDAADGVASLGHHDPNEGLLGLELEPADGLFSVVDAAGEPVFQVTADGTVTFGSGGGKVGMEIDPDTGQFSVVDEDGDPVFQVDTQAKTVNTAKGYSRGTIGSGGA